jgi:predicted O-methyltransferase YrrM
VKLAIKRTTLELVQRLRELREQFSTRPELEIVYRDLFRQVLDREGVADTFFPVRGAANYSLMYLVARIVTELRPDRIVELGAGQSTLLIDKLAGGLGPAAKITTLEHDADWVAHIGGSVRHPVLHSGLRRRAVAGIDVAGYEFGELPAGPVQFLIVDGPPAKGAATRYARLAALELAERLDPAGFVIVIDDAERPGEAMLGSLLERELRGRGVALRRSRTNALKRQEVIGAGRFIGATYF